MSKEPDEKLAEFLEAFEEAIVEVEPLCEGHPGDRAIAYFAYGVISTILGNDEAALALLKLSIDNGLLD